MNKAWLNTTVVGDIDAPWDTLDRLHRLPAS